MQELNTGFIVELYDNELWIETGGKGVFSVKIDEAQSQLNLLSPVSGTFEYKYDAENESWLSCKDYHDMRGLITRDLLRICIGCPKF